MPTYTGSWLVRIGLGLLIVGITPLLVVLIFSSDPNPNPIGLGLLAFVTFWPGVGCLLFGLARVWWQRR